MADSQVNLELVKTDAIVPPPDSLIAGPHGVGYSSVIRIEQAGDFKRGTLLMRVSGSKVFVPSTAEGLANAKEVVILCDDVEIKDDEFAEVAGYFGGDFNSARVILPYETESDDHAELIEEIAPYLRSHGIYLRDQVE